MPVVMKQTPPKPVDLPRMNDILDAGIPAALLATGRIVVCCYGRNGCGKTTWACQKRTPTERCALIAVDPAPNGGARSVKHMSNVTVYQVAARYINGETVKGSQKMIAIADSIKKRFAMGQRPFDKVVVDGLNSWNEIILSEVLGTDYESMPAILSKDAVTTDNYRERSEKLIKYLRSYVDLPCDVVLLCQEKDHNPPRDEKNRIVGSKLMREAHPMAQSGSFISLALGDEQARWVQNACDFVMQLYEDDEVREIEIPDPSTGGMVKTGQYAATGKRVRRLRCTYHPNYAARFREDYHNVPEYIEAPTPEERYQAFLDVVSGKRTKWGYYPK